MITNFEKVLEFHKAFGAVIEDKPQWPKRLDLRMDLIREEMQELEDVVEQRDFIGFVDALADLKYVIYGMEIESGIPSDAVFDEVHSSNMSKLDDQGNPILRDDGKILKGPNFKLPNIIDIITRYSV